MELNGRDRATGPRGGGSRESVEPARIGLDLVAEGFVSPVAMACPPDGSGRMFIVDQPGTVWVLDRDGRTEDEPFLDMTSDVVRLNPGYDERGLLGLAFHPHYRTNGKFYVFYSAPLREGGPRGWNCTNHLVEMLAHRDGRERADPGSGRVLLSVDKPQPNHNGGHITFGPDGYLYVPLGDGGAGNDRGLGHHPDKGNSQDLEVLLGKILRIDVDRRGGGREYGIPPDNPFVAGSGRPEIFAYGLRNPYHIAFDAGGDHELFTGDVGQLRWEEVDIIVSGGNYGWNLMEGRHHFDPGDNLADVLGRQTTGYLGEELIGPIVEYANLSNRTGGIGQAIIGGYVYRGRDLPFLQGRYVFGDWSGTRDAPDGRLFVASPPSRGPAWSMDELTIEGRGRLGEYLTSFGQDLDNEIYVLGSLYDGPRGDTGRVHRITAPGGGAKRRP
ncbi:MAG: PQQ-dependent sugar dehydrogenase [Methanomassiliicoccus sp.]|nr:PQQ-dependent sugar dehydrogenase [Methanomassiliicoccus sp.]